MHSLYYKVFNYLDNSQPSHLGIYFSLFLHLSILLFAIGLPDFFKPKQIAIPQVIPIEILNVSDVTSLTAKNNNIEIDNKQIKKIKQKKFNSSKNTEIQKINLQEKPKNKIIQTENTISKKIDTIKIPLKEKQNKELKNKKKVVINNVETLKKKKITPKLKPKPIEKKDTQTDLDIESKLNPVIKKNDEKIIIDKPKLIQKPKQDFNIASMLKDLRNEEILNISEAENTNTDIKDNNEKNNQIMPNLEVSISEMDLVIQQLRSCFNPRAGTQIVGNEMVRISAKIDRKAYVKKDTVQIIDTNISNSNPYYESITESALATLYNPICSKLKLPLNKYESWKDLTITIDYSWIKN